VTDLLSQLGSNAQTIDHLWRKVHETAERRGRSTADHDIWAKACEEFHRKYPDLMFPGGYQRWKAFLARDSSELDTAISFLEVDPRFFRSGYLKQIIWDRLKRAELNPKQEHRLEAIAHSYLHKRVQREFWHMARYIRRCGSTNFWEALESIATKRNGEPSMKANWLLLVRKNVAVRQWIGHEFSRARYEPGYVPNLWFDHVSLG
jgi:hypothetical protein